MQDPNNTISFAMAIAQKEARRYPYVNAEDLAQAAAEVFLLTDLTKVNNLGGWVWAVVRNLASAAVRADRRSRGLMPRQGVAPDRHRWCSVTAVSLDALGWEAAGCHPEQVADGAVLRLAIGRAFAALHDRDKPIIAMIFEEFRAREIAEACGIEVGAAKKQIERARRRYRLLLADELGQ
jgi:RNA polymerase sigma factor (sigma-70 family)